MFDVCCRGMEVSGLTISRSIVWGLLGETQKKGVTEGGCQYHGGLGRWLNGQSTLCACEELGLIPCTTQSPEWSTDPLSTTLNRT